MTAALAIAVATLAIFGVMILFALVVVIVNTRHVVRDEARDDDPAQYESAPGRKVAPVERLPVN